MKIVTLVARWIGALFLVLLTNIFGLIVGATYGGNFDVHFYFANVAGYEAWGILGAQLFSTLGLAGGAWLVVPKTWQLPRKVIAVGALFSTVFTMTWQLYSDVYAMRPWFIMLSPLVYLAITLYGYYFMSTKAKRWLYGTLLIIITVLGTMLVYTLAYNYACLRFTTICFVQSPAVAVTLDQPTVVVQEPIKLVSRLSLYGDIYTLEKYCSDIEIFWEFGDGDTTSKSGCDNYPPNMQPTMRGWVKHTYAQAGQYTVTVTLRYRDRALNMATYNLTVQ